MSGDPRGVMQGVETEEGALCCTCLVAGRALRQVAHASLIGYYYHILNEITMARADRPSPLVCWECAALLRRSLAFCEQVRDSHRLLNTCADQNLRDCLLGDISRPPRLKTHQTSSIDILPTAEKSIIDDAAIEIEININAAATINESKNEPEKLEEVQLSPVKCETEPFWGKVEIKKESDLSDMDDDCLFRSDDSDDLAQLESDVKAFIKGGKSAGSKSKIKKKKKVKENTVKKVDKLVKSLKKVKKLVPLKRRTKKSEEPLKIRTLEMSYEEMLEERAKDATRDSYVKAEFKCQDCLVGFSYDKSYADHMLNKHNPKLGDYSCPICKTIIASVDSFTAHYKRHLRRYECALCGKRTMDRKVMTQHYESTHEAGSKEYMCHCGKISHSMDAHRYHKDTHKARVECNECDKTFSHRAGLMNHRLSVHKLNNMFPCSLCDKVFRWKASLKKHLERHERKFRPPPDAPFCEPCGVSFSSTCTYQRHMKNSLKHVTENELKFICADCNRKFVNKTKLRDHIEEKHLHKSYHCHICLKPSKNRVCLDQHIRNVHKGRPNNKMCHHCGKGFPTKVQLDSHIRSHTGERPFICEFCPTTFSQQSNLYKHNRQVHLNIKAKRYPPLCRKKKDKKPDAAPSMEQPLMQHAQTDLFHLVM